MMNILRWRVWVGGSLLGMALAGCSGLHEGGRPVSPREVSFAAGRVGGLPPGFRTALTGSGGPGVWALRPEATAPGGGPVLVQESAETNSYRFPLCIYQGVVARDVAAEVKYKAISGTVDQAGGIVLRYRPENYYIARANALENNVILFKVVAGKRSKIVEVPVPVSAGQWHTLRFEAKGRHLEIGFDGRVVVAQDDDTFSNAGKVGLWTKADSVSAFAGFKIEPPQ